MLSFIKILVFAAIYSLAIESIAIATGFPYGFFSYSEMLSAKLFGINPWTVGFVWHTIFIAAIVFSNNLFKNNVWKKILFGTVFMVFLDLIIDPASVHLGFWSWAEPGFYYGVPFVNFAGWILTSFIAFVIAFYFFGRKLGSVTDIRVS